ncbi:MAG: hypothetical protein U1F57_05420 [bacterium]
MSKKLITLIQTLSLVIGLGTAAYAQDMTVDVYENGVNVGTMTFPASQYPDVVNRVSGTNVTIKPQNNDAEARRRAAQARMDEWNRQEMQRRMAAQAQQQQLNQQFEQRHNAAQQRMDEWNRQEEQRHAAAQAQQERWRQQFEQRHAAAQQGYQAWRMSR